MSRMRWLGLVALGLLPFMPAIGTASSQTLAQIPHNAPRECRHGGLCAGFPRLCANVHMCIKLCPWLNKSLINECKALENR